jgi:hypothetical protein
MIMISLLITWVRYCTVSLTVTCKARSCSDIHQVLRVSVKVRLRRAIFFCRIAIEDRRQKSEAFCLNVISTKKNPKGLYAIEDRRCNLEMRKS